MKNKNFRIYYLFALLGLLTASFYPLYMGVKVIADMIENGTVMKENYPKYIIPYTPIAIALLMGLLLLPLLVKLCKKYALLAGSAFSVAAFFAVEFLLEEKVVVTSFEAVTKLEDWQMYMCYRPYVELKQQTPVEILMGEYNPFFKLHFYMISLVLILAVLGCLYGFGQMAETGERKRLKPLVLQSAASLTFLGLCILACFTAFWRDGNLQVSPLSASLMAIFFILLGMVGGIYTGSFLPDKRTGLSIALPAAVAMLLTVLMYVGELILLHGNLYRFGTGFLFEGLPGIVLAPVDLLVILAAGGFTALAFWLLREKQRAVK